jgi:hypothetical protein
MTAPHREISWRKALAVYLAGSAGLHLIWETLQLPLYTIWRTGTNLEIAFAVIHCTAGDVMIAAVSLLAAVLLFQHRTWPPQHWVPIVVATLSFGIAVTIYSEWLNTVVRKAWAYSDLMPTFPVVGTGLSPLLQWVVVPLGAFILTERISRMPPYKLRS